MEVLLCERVNDLRHSLFHLLNCVKKTASKISLSLGNKQKSQGAREAEELPWCQSWSNSLWQGWNGGLVHCPVGNATNSIWSELASSDGIFTWTPLKPQHSKPNPNPKSLANQLWCIDFLTPSTLLTIPYRLPPSWNSYATQKLLLDSCKVLRKKSEALYKFLLHFSKFKTKLYCLSFF